MSSPARVEPGAEELAHAQILSIVAGIVLAMFLGALDQTIIAAALPTMARQFGDFENVSWVASIYFLTSTAVTPLYGKFSDIHGRRIALLLGIATFVVGSIGSALAPSMFALIAARAIQGLGGGGLISLAQTIVADIVAPKDRGRYQIIFASVFLAASLMGPTLGGLLTEHLHWSFIFWINLPLGAIAYRMTSESLKRLPRHDRPHKLDVLGALLMVIATVTIMLALSSGGLRFPWASPEIAGLVGASLFFWFMFGWRIVRAQEPLIPVDILSNRVVLTGTASAFFGMGTYIALTIHMPVYFETVRGLSVSESGLALIPLMVGTVVGATLAGQTMGRLTHYKRLPMAGLVVAIAGTILLALRGHVWPLWGLELDLSVISIGLGGLLPTTMVAIQNAVSAHRMGTATGAMNFFRQLGSALFIAIFGAILLNAGIHEAKVPANNQLAVAAYFPLFMAAATGFALALVFILRMEELPLRAKSAVRNTIAAD